MEATAVRPEIFFGLVGATGTPLELVTAELADALATASYRVEEVRISEMLDEVLGKLDGEQSEYRRIGDRMNKGNELRKRTDLPSAAASLSLLGIRRRRRSHVSNPDAEDASVTEATGVAYVIRSLKRKEEVEALKEIYGDRFYLVAAYSPRDARIQSLARSIARSMTHLDFEPHLTEATNLVDRDQGELDVRYGQRLRDTFPLADVFVPVGDDTLRKEVRRFIELIFGNPFRTPTQDEVGMFVAEASALRSGDLSRQVGASITLAPTGSLLAVGTNEVPRAGGGQYWEDDPSDDRDLVHGVDTGAQSRVAIVEDIFKRLNDAGWLNPDKNDPPENLARIALFENQPDGDVPVLRNALVSALTEYGRAVHAEMSAITDAAMRGVGLKGTTLFSTTFPCHNCARHIISSGISRVVFIEPYPKSYAAILYPEAIQVEPDGVDEARIPFEPFMGISPRRYQELFDRNSVERKTQDGRITGWSLANAAPAFVDATNTSFLSREGHAIEAIEKQLREMEIIEL